MKIRLPLLFLLLAPLLTGGCDHSPAGLPMVSVPIGTATFNLEIARTPDQQEVGLMKRDSMPANHGMIFVFDSEEVLYFWMKNTRFPLDIVFLDSQGTVVSIRQMQAYDLNRTSSLAPARYAIELNQGKAATCGLKVGDRVQLPPEARAK